MTLDGAVKNDVLVRARLLGADIATGAAALRTAVAAGQSVTHLIAHPSGLTVSSFASGRPAQSFLAGLNQTSPLRPAMGEQVSRA